MKCILRIKAVSSCMGIRRALLCYTALENKTINLKTIGHPISGFEEAKIEENQVTVLGKTEKLAPGEEIYFYKNNKRKSLTGEVLEQMTLGILLMPLAKEAIDYYESSIKEGYLFDQWNGEFEYIIGMVYELELKDKKNADLWYEKAKGKGFSFPRI